MVKKYDLFLFRTRSTANSSDTGSPYISACHLEGIGAERRADRLGVETLLECGIRIGALITEEQDAAQCGDEILPGALRRRSSGQIIAEASDRRAAVVQHRGLRGVHRTPQMPDRRTEPHPGRLLADPDGGFHTVARLPVDDSDKVLRLVSLGFRIRRRNRYDGLRRASTRSRNAAATRSASPMSLKKEDLERALLILGKAGSLQRQKIKTRPASEAGLAHFRETRRPDNPETLTTRREARRPGNPILPPRQSPAPGREVSAAEVHGPLRCSLEYPAVPEHPAAPDNPGRPDNPAIPGPQPRQSPPLRQSHPPPPGGAYYKSVSIPGETSEQNPPIRPILYHLVQFSGILDQKVWAEGIVFLLLPRFCMPGGMPSINQTNSL